MQRQEYAIHYSPCPPCLREGKRRNILRLYSTITGTCAKWIYSPVVVNNERILYATSRTCAHYPPCPPRLREKNTLNFQLLPLLVFFILPLLSVIYF